MSMENVSDDSIVLDADALYWTGSGWAADPAAAVDLALIDAARLSVETRLSTILCNSQMIEVDQDISDGQSCFWVNYPDHTDECYPSGVDAVKAICAWDFF